MEHKATYLYPKRKSPRIREFDYSSAYMYHVVMVTENRLKVFGEIVNGQMILNHEGHIADKAIRGIPDHYPRVDIEESIIMPDHIHLLLSIEGDPQVPSNPDLRKIISAFKSIVSRQCGRPIWQRSFYDHIIRNDQDYMETVYYIQGNPIEWELAHQ